MAQTPLSMRDSQLALLELKLSSTARKFDAFRRDVVVFLLLGLLLLPLLLRLIDTVADPDVRYPLSIAIAAMLVGIPAWFRERRENRAEAKRRQSIYLSIRPDLFE